MRDGKSLAADLYLPSASGSWPVILIQTPYDKSAFSSKFTSSNSTDPLFTSSSYAWVVLDWRGYFASSGAGYSGSPSRGQDGYDAVEWIARQKWSNGKVGAWGYSALGMALMATAQEAPPHLFTAAPITYIWREGYDDLSYPGGVYQKNRNDSNFGNGYMTKPHPLYDSWWSYLDANASPVNQIQIPMLHVSGWYDHETDATLREWQRVQSGGAPNAIGKQKVLIGPWTHASVDQAQQGQLSYADASTSAAQAALQLFDFYLRGLANGYDEQPTFRFYQMNEARWVGSATWPLAGITTQTQYLRASGTMGPAAPGASETPRSYVADPSHPVPTVYGAVLDETNATRGPGDLRSIESRGDVLGFTTAAMTQPLAISGRPVAHLHFTTTTVDTDFAVRITQVRQDGSSMLIVDSIHRGSLRNQYTSRDMLSSGTVYAVDVTLPSVAITIPAGDRLRVLVEPSNYDRFDANMQDGSSHSDDPGAKAIAGTVQLLLDAAHPSTLDLPVVGAGTAPSAPTALTATAASSNSIALAWQDTSTNETGFVIRRSTDGTNFTTVATVSANGTRYTDTGLSPSTVYWYRVKASGQTNNSASSNTASATTLALPPSAPTNLAVVSVSSTKINLAWQDHSSNETGFTVERSTDGKSFSAVATVNANVTTWSNTGLKLNKLYYFRVCAFNGAGSSAYSNVVSARTPLF